MAGTEPLFRRTITKNFHLVILVFAYWTTAERQQPQVGKKLA